MNDAINWSAVDVPAWANSSGAAYAFFVGLVLGAMVRLVRIGLKWFRKAGGPDHSASE